MTAPKSDALAGCAAQGVGAEGDPATAGDKIVQQVDAARIEKLHRTWPALAAIAHLCERCAVEVRRSARRLCRYPRPGARPIAQLASIWPAGGAARRTNIGSIVA